MLTGKVPALKLLQQYCLIIPPSDKNNCDHCPLNNYMYLFLRMAFLNVIKQDPKKYVEKQGLSMVRSIIQSSKQYLYFCWYKKFNHQNDVFTSAGIRRDEWSYTKKLNT